MPEVEAEEEATEEGAVEIIIKIKMQPWQVQIALIEELVKEAEDTQLKNGKILQLPKSAKFIENVKDTLQRVLSHQCYVKGRIKMLTTFPHLQLL
jgi:hypothetical protein